MRIIGLIRKGKFFKYFKNEIAQQCVISIIYHLASRQRNNDFFFQIPYSIVAGFLQKKYFIIKVFYNGLFNIKGNVF